MQQRIPSLRSRPIAFAHRGARAHAPENTLEAFALGLRLGATGLESDVWLTADGAVVFDHDGVVRRRRRRRPIGDLPRDDLPPHIPTLTELLETCGTDYDLSLDLKVAEAAPAVIEAVRAVDPAMLPRVWLCHASVDVLAALRSIDAEVRLVNSTRLARMKEGPERRAAILAEAGIDAVNMHHTDWNGGLTTLFHRFERVAFGWDMQFDHVLRPALRMGLDGVYSDVVDVMVDCFKLELGAAPAELPA